MRTVWKVNLRDAFATAEDVQGTAIIRVELPDEAEPLAVQTQNGTAMLWVEVDTEQPRHHRHFAIAGTGHTLPVFVTLWVGTWQEEPFVWHLYWVDPVQLELARGEVA